MSKLFKRFAKDESGATAIEYALIAALIALAIVFGARQLGGAINQKFIDIAGQVTNPPAGGGTGTGTGTGQ